MLGKSFVRYRVLLRVIYGCNVGFSIALRDAIVSVSGSLRFYWPIECYGEESKLSNACKNERYHKWH